MSCTLWYSALLGVVAPTIGWAAVRNARLALVAFWMAAASAAELPVSCVQLLERRKAPATSVYSRIDLLAAVTRLYSSIPTGCVTLRLRHQSSSDHGPMSRSDR